MTSLWPESEHLLAKKVLDRIAQDPMNAHQISDETLALLRQEKYFGLAVPVAFEGGGASLVDSCVVQMRLAAANLGLAIGFNMHLFTVGVLIEHWQHKQDTSWALLEAIATQNRIIASAFAEPMLGGSVLRSRCRGIRVDGGYLVSGVKSPCSLAARSDLICLQFETEEFRPDTLLVALIHAGAEGIEVEKTWHPSGLHASESDTIHLRNCFIPDEVVFYRTSPGIDTDNTFTAGFVRFALLTTIVYIGAAKAALQRAATTMQSSRIPPGNTVRADVPTLQSALGELFAPILSLEAACFGLASAYDTGMSADDCLTWAMAVKHDSAAACTKAISGAMELCGGGSFSAQSPLARTAADMQAIHFHPPTRFVLRRGIASTFLGKSRTFDLFE